MSALVVLKIDAVRLDIEIPQDLDLVAFYHLLWFEVGYHFSSFILEGIYTDAK